MAKSRKFTTEELKAMGINVFEPIRTQVNTNSLNPKSKNGKMSQQTFNKIQSIYADPMLRKRYAEQLNSNILDSTLMDPQLDDLVFNKNVNEYDLFRMLRPTSEDMQNSNLTQKALDTFNAVKSKYPNSSRYFTGAPNHIAPEWTDGINMFEPDSTIHWSSGPFEPNLPNNIYTTATSGGGNSTVPPPKGPGGIKGFFNDTWNNAKGIGGNALNYIKAHPGMSAALGLGGAANLGGIFDNDKIGGQLLGATGAGLGAHFIPKLLGSTPLGIPAQVAIGLGGGAVGALFDKLRAKREQEQNQYYGGY